MCLSIQKYLPNPAQKLSVGYPTVAGCRATMHLTLSNSSGYLEMASNCVFSLISTCVENVTIAFPSFAVAWLFEQNYNLHIKDEVD